MSTKKDSYKRQKFNGDSQNAVSNVNYCPYAIEREQNSRGTKTVVNGQ